VLFYIEGKDFMDWKLFFQGVTSFGVVATFIGAIFVVKKYYYEKNRDVYIRRLNEVYAPLFGMVVKQEEVRSSFMNDYAFTAAPIISINTVKEKFSKDGYSRENIPGIIHRNNFIKHFHDIEVGLASPKLLELINRFEVLNSMIIDKEYNEDNKDDLEERLVDIEIELIVEIVQGYYNTIKKLDIDAGYEKIYIADV
jgi:hypothetical protein